MYWDLGLLPGTSKKWKVYPIGASAGNAHFPALNRQGQGMVFGAFVLSDTSKNKN
jgi:hypothetical protein